MMIAGEEVKLALPGRLKQEVAAKHILYREIVLVRPNGKS